MRDKYAVKNGKSKSDNNQSEISKDNQHGVEDGSKRDVFYVNLMLFHALGSLGVISSHFFPTANDYWMYKFRDPDVSNYSFNETSKTGLQTQFTAVYSIVSHSCNGLLLIAYIILLRRMSILKRINLGLLILLTLFTITVIFVGINTDSWQYGFFIMTLITGGILTWGACLVLVTMFELVIKFPPRFFTGFLAGNSLCGVMTALAQILSVALGRNSKRNGLIYFLIGTLFVLLTFIVLMSVKAKSEFFNHYYSSKNETKASQTTSTKTKLIQVFAKVKYFMVPLVLTLGTTVIVHPGVTALIQSVDKGNGNRWNDDFFVPVVTFLCFYLFEFAGREAAGIFKRPKNVFVLILLSAARVLFIPIIMFCNVHPRHHLTVIFNEDWYYIVFIIIFAFSGGYIVNLTALRVTEVPKREERAFSAMLLITFMFVGVILCSFLAPVVIDGI